MKIFFRRNVYGWIMTGIIANDASWFFGYSKRPENRKLMKSSTMKSNIVNLANVRGTESE